MRVFTRAATRMSGCDARPIRNPPAETASSTRLLTYQGDGETRPSRAQSSHFGGLPQNFNPAAHEFLWNTLCAYRKWPFLARCKEG